MKKMIISIIACMALMSGAFFAWACYKDVLATILFIGALIPSCLFEQGRQERKARRQ